MGLGDDTTHIILTLLFFFFCFGVVSFYIGWISLDFPQRGRNSPMSLSRLSGKSQIGEISILSQLNIFVELATASWKVEGAGPTFQSINAVIFRVSREDWTRTSFHRSSAVHLRLVDYQSVFALRGLPVASPFPFYGSAILIV